MVPPERLMHPHPLSTGWKSASRLSRARVTHLQMGLQSLEAEKGPQLAHRPVIWALSYRLNQRTLQNITEPCMLPHHLDSLSDNCPTFTNSLPNSWYKAVCMWDSYGTYDLNPPLPHTSLAPMTVTRGTQAPSQPLKMVTIPQSTERVKCLLKKVDVKIEQTLFQI